MNSHVSLVINLFALMGTGVLLRKIGLIPESGKKFLTDLVIDLILPCNIVSSFLSGTYRNHADQTTTIFLISACIQLGSYMVGLVAYRCCEKKHQTVLKYATICSNSGILGTPVTEGVFGAEGSLLSSVFLIPPRIIMWTLGVSLFTKSKSGFSMKKAATHPCIVAVGIGLVVMLAGFSVPPIVQNYISTIGKCNTAISMLLVGSIIADLSPHLLLHHETLYYTFIRLLALPLAVFLGCKAWDIDPLVRNICVILTAMPAGTTTSIMALKYGEDAEFASACTALTTFISLLALPLWCAFLL